MFYTNGVGADEKNETIDYFQNQVSSYKITTVDLKKQIQQQAEQLSHRTRENEELTSKMHSKKVPDETLKKFLGDLKSVLEAV